MRRRGQRGEALGDVMQVSKPHDTDRDMHDGEDLRLLAMDLRISGSSITAN
jgi:hypothetical protein